jgi:ABC-type glutathione transport system ATPase component
LLRLSKTEEKARVASLMERVRLPASLADRRPGELSGGQLKRVCIARALATSPRYLIFDEATSGLDVLVKETILDLIRELHRETGAATLMITHDMDAALYMADRIAVMLRGEIVENRLYTGDLSCLTHPYSHRLLEQMEPYA